MSETFSSGYAQALRSSRPTIPINPANVPVANMPAIQPGIEEAAARFLTIEGGLPQSGTGIFARLFLG